MCYCDVYGQEDANTISKLVSISNEDTANIISNSFLGPTSSLMPIMSKFNLSLSSYLYIFTLRMYSKQYISLDNNHINETFQNQTRVEKQQRQKQQNRI